MTASPYELSGKRVWVAGHLGMVGSALVRRLERENCTILTCRHDEVDLSRQDQVETWMQKFHPDAVFHAAGLVGGILANNTRPAEFIYENLAIESNVIHTAWKTGVEKLLFLGSSCIYPREATQPMSEEALLSGPLEPTNQWYAIAKIAGIKMCQAYRRQYGCDFISAQPTNLYGPGDTYDLKKSHVIPAIMMKAHTAKKQGNTALEIWGSGKPKREFLHVDDLADAVVFLMKNYSDEIQINVGSSMEVTIGELSEIICRAVGYRGELVFNTDQPDGSPRKLVECTRLHKLGWNDDRPLEDGLIDTYQWYLDNKT
jgi:GDP-L-fucose synthase